MRLTEALLRLRRKCESFLNLQKFFFLIFLNIFHLKSIHWVFQGLTESRLRTLRPVVTAYILFSMACKEENVHYFITEVKNKINLQSQRLLSNITWS